MGNEEKIYALMAHAEDLQAHAASLQNKAQQTFDSLSHAVEDAETHIRSTRIQGAFCLVLVGCVVAAIAVTGIWLGTVSLRQRVEKLYAEVERLEVRAETFAQKAGKAELSVCGEERRLCIRVDEKAGKYESGFMVIEGY